MTIHTYKGNGHYETSYLGSALDNQEVLSGRQRQAEDEAGELLTCIVCGEASVSDDNGVRVRSGGWVHVECNEEEQNDEG